MRNRMLLVAAIAILIAAPAMAFHHGGVAQCQGCHTMHNSQGGVGMNSASTKIADGGAGTGTPVGEGYQYLLLLPNATDTCLNCHARDGGYGVWATTVTPALSDYYSAGNFVFLGEDNINDGRGGATSPIAGEQSGHNMRSLIKGTTWDSVLDAPPGSNIGIGNDIECTSCHDPHGTDSFRMLYQDGQQVDVGGVVVTYNATMEADEIGYSSTEANNLHNAYHSGYSEWCGTCHGDFHSASGSFVHPSGEFLTQQIVDKYNAYRGTADCIANPPAAGNPCGSGDSQTAYLADVPFESALGVTTVSMDGPTTQAKVACVSCHRAHATSARDAGRWDFQVGILDDDGVNSGSWAIPNTYAGTHQKSLCNKCHSQDEFDAPPEP